VPRRVQFRRRRSAVLGALVIQRLGSRPTLARMSRARDRDCARDDRDAFASTDDAGLIAMFASPAAFSTRSRRRCTRWRRMCIRPKFAGPGGYGSRLGRVGNGWPRTSAPSRSMRARPTFFATWAVSMTVVFGSLALVRRHIARPERPPQRA